MSKHPFRTAPTPSARSQRGAALPWVFFGFLAVAGFFLLSEHRAHVMGALPFVLLALCPLMHLLHRGHGGHGHQGGSGGHRGHGPAGPGASDADGPPPGQAAVGPAPTTPSAPPPPHQH